jgi:hypothetical protein
MAIKALGSGVVIKKAPLKALRPGSSQTNNEKKPGFLGATRARFIFI